MLLNILIMYELVTLTNKRGHNLEHIPSKYLIDECERRSSVFSFKEVHQFGLRKMACLFSFINEFYSYTL